MADYRMKARDKAANTLSEAPEWAEKGFHFDLGGVKVRVARTPGPIHPEASIRLTTRSSTTSWRQRPAPFRHRWMSGAAIDF